jgi:hypothetical protein
MQENKVEAEKISLNGMFSIANQMLCVIGENPEHGVDDDGFLKHLNGQVLRIKKKKIS